MPQMFLLIQMKLYWCVACLKGKAGTGADQHYFISNVSNVLCHFTSNWTLLFSDYYLFFQHEEEDFKIKKKNNNEIITYLSSLVLDKTLLVIAMAMSISPCLLMDIMMKKLETINY